MALEVVRHRVEARFAAQEKLQGFDKARWDLNVRAKQSKLNAGKPKSEWVGREDALLVLRDESMTEV